MDLAYRIEHIKPYFISFNVVAEESAAYAVVRIPKGWTIPDKTALKENFKVEIAPIQEGICFVTEITNGSDCIFDAIDYVVDFNKKVEERKGLFEEKIKELGDIFARETLESLKNLKFVIEMPKKSAKKAKPKDFSKPPEPIQVESEPKNEENEPIQEIPVTEGVTEAKATDDNSLMAFAKTITES